MSRSLSRPAGLAGIVPTFLGLAGIGAALLMGGCTTQPGGRTAPGRTMEPQSRDAAEPQSGDAAGHFNAPPLDPRQRADFVLVKKARRELILYQHGRPLRVYRISLGPHPIGPKEREGDGRTPEGRYVLDWRNARSKYYLSLHVSYPDARDRARARRMGVRPGGDIMVHGIGPQGSPGMTATQAGDWTAGCIAVSDADMKEIWRAVPDGTPIDITP